MTSSFWAYFYDPVLRAPMLGSMLMCVSASLVGVLVFLRKQSLIGETLSHASYPGVVVGVIVIGLMFGDLTGSQYSGPAMLCGAFLFALLGVRILRFLEKKLKVYPDAALCFVLSFFFGFGILLSSEIQISLSNLYRQVQTYFYGQAATLTDLHISLYGFLVLLIGSLLYLFRKEFKTWLFDPKFAKVSGINIPLLETIFLLLVTASIVIGIRSVGVVLMSAMLIAPAAAARQCTHRLRRMFFLAATFGMISAALGTYLANEISWWLINKYPGTRMTLPTGPMIVLMSSLICIGALLFAPDRGLLIRFFRVIHFKSTCLQENLLKTLWRFGPSSLPSLKEHLLVSTPFLYWVAFRLKRKGWVVKKGLNYELTDQGGVYARQIIRLHRLWELYLSDYVGIGPKRVHASAEEMEHILTPELERELTEILSDPIFDPHHQPIPPKEG